MSIYGIIELHIIHKREFFNKFFEKNDTLHDNYRNEYPSEEMNEYFNSFIKVEPVDVNLSKNFIIRKLSSRLYVDEKSVYGRARRRTHSLL